MEFLLPKKFIQGTVRIALVGVGGNGCQMLAGLARIHVALKELGHPGGFDVTAFDDDCVSESNIGRQLFSYADIGINKAVVMIHRYNQFFGLDWKAVPTRFKPQSSHLGFDLIISCVDSKASRREIHSFAAGRNAYGFSSALWLDMGNEQHTGQVVLGEMRRLSSYIKKREKAALMPNVTELFPDILDESIPESDTPSCSVAESLERQDLFVNQQAATAALNLLWQLFRNGKINQHGCFFNLKTNSMQPLWIDPDTWKRFMKPLRKHRAKKAETA